MIDGDPRRPGKQPDHTAQTVRASSDTTSQARKPLVDPKSKGVNPDMKTESTAAQQEAAASSGSESFQRFYSTFENLISKLSAPLAFAGLPLTGDVPPPVTPEKTPTRERTEEHERAGTDPDLSKIFSKAALRAVKERTGPNGLGTGGESFYVVPTTGGTISYANILSRAEEERRAGLEGRERLEDDEEPEFVDASETPHPPSPEKSRHGVGRPWRIGSRPHQQSLSRSTKTMEELQVENQALKQLSDTLSRRLHMWEMNAQSSSMALQHSLRALQRSQAASDGGKYSGDDPSEKLKEVEEQLRNTRKEMEKLGRENEKLRGVVARYREKWEKLKEGARMRREGTRAEDTKE